MNVMIPADRDEILQRIDRAINTLMVAKETAKIESLGVLPLMALVKLAIRDLLGDRGERQLLTEKDGGVGDV